MEQSENTDTRIQFGLRIEADLYSVISALAVKEDRSLSNTIHWLLKQNPHVQELLDTTQADAAGVNA